MIHCPPVNTALDVLASGKHVGSQGVRVALETFGDSIACSLHGHIHETVDSNKRNQFQERVGILFNLPFQ